MSKRTESHVSGAGVNEGLVTKPVRTTGATLDRDQQANGRDLRWSLPAGQAAGRRCVAGVAAGSVWTREKRRVPRWSWGRRGSDLGSGARWPDPAASPGAPPVALPPCSQQPAAEEEGLPAVPQRRAEGGIQDSGGRPEPRRRSHSAAVAAAAPESCD